MKVFVIGTRGIPNIQGGVETHCEELFTRLSKLGCDVYLIRRSYYFINAGKLEEYRGVKLKTIYAPHIKSIEAVVHTFLSILWAKKQNADIIHIHAIGPALLTPFARLLGMKVVFTHHGHDYNRSKWGRFAKMVLKIGEKLGTNCANEVIVISEHIRQSIIKKYRYKNSHLIFNGVNTPVPTQKTDILEALELKSREYIFTLGRFVEEKGFDLLIRAYAKNLQGGIRLVIAGDADHTTAYSRQLKELAKQNNVILTGIIKGEILHELFSHARLFVLPSYHEGLPISLLEAMSYNLPVLVSDIPANTLAALPENCFFETGKENSLISKLNQELQHSFAPVKYDMTPYNWDQIATQTMTVYRKVLKLPAI